jgi:hypothetical protein
MSYTSLSLRGSSGLISSLLQSTAVPDTNRGSRKMIRGSEHRKGGRGGRRGSLGLGSSWGEVGRLIEVDHDAVHLKTGQERTRGVMSEDERGGGVATSVGWSLPRDQS